METIELWKDRERQIIDPELFSRTADELANEVCSEGKSAKNANKGSQLRKFYDEVVRLSLLVKSDPNNNKWENILPMINMLVAKAAYAQGRKLITDSFLNFIKDSVAQIKRPEDLNVFSNFFEAFMGFYKFYNPND